jgi:hypothetical protein
MIGSLDDCPLLPDDIYSFFSKRTYLDDLLNSNLRTKKGSNEDMNRKEKQDKFHLPEKFQNPHHLS